jgi:hypothetical protein
VLEQDSQDALTLLQPHLAKEPRMRPALILAAALLLAQNAVMAQFEWANVKAWKGTVTIEMTDDRSKAPAVWKLTYKATGEVLLTDDMMPEGSHMQWPMPSVEAMTDPARREHVYDTWQSRVTAKLDSKGLDEMGAPYAYSCTADNKIPEKVGLAVSPSDTKYVLTVSLPDAKYTCTGPHGSPPAGLPQEAFQLKGERKAPGPISGSQTFTVVSATIKITYNLAPVN